MTANELRSRRALAQGLHRPAGLDAAGVVRRLLAVQGQELRSARRAVRSRSRGTTAAGVDRLLTEDRSLVVTWVNRGTLHLIDREDYPWLLGLTGPPSVAFNQARLRQEGVAAGDAERGVAAIVAALADEGPLTRAVLRERLEAASVPNAGQALVHLLLLTGLRGLTVRGPVVSAAGQAFALTQDWLGIEPPAPLAGDARDRALAELARRYLSGHGPATDADLAFWAGLPRRDAQRGLQLIATELTELGDGFVDLARRPDADAAGRLQPRLLGSFDPVVIGWKRRDLVVAPEHQPGWFTKNGILPACALVRGRAVAAWSTTRGGDLQLRPYAGTALPATTVAALERDYAGLQRFEAG
ncbi:hypothetical protein DSM112329_05444 [Paraconexibacter sp. AEG42_29]|uniref:Winged helix DNA-binding domain-containing protein n=1 Tax=Paraconexibacter sp. AEG42_29 TaxID=2997339 RepID=A0AAU7B3S4_9ACTN